MAPAVTEDVTVTRIVSEPHPNLREREGQQWLEAQIPYPTLAGDSKIAQRALQFANAIQTRHERDMKAKIHRWRGLDYLLRGNSVDSAAARDVHVPEVLKALLSLGPRVVEAVFGTGRRWFEVVSTEILEQLPLFKGGEPLLLNSVIGALQSTSATPARRSSTSATWLGRCTSSAGERPR